MPGHYGFMKPPKGGKPKPVMSKAAKKKGGKKK
jgi:hypothetical protein